MTEARRAAIRICMNPEEITESWVQRWRCRHSIKSIGLQGEAADCANYSDWLVAHRDILHQYKPENILNFDKTALFWRCPNKRTYVLATEGSQVKGCKASKARVTFLIGCAVDGKKESLIAIGTSAKPRWPVLPDQKVRANAHVTYYSSKKGSTNQEIFAIILANMEIRFKQEKKRKCLVGKIHICACSCCRKIQPASYSLATKGLPDR